MIQIINTPAENRVLLDANNTEISIQSTNGAGFYFRALIYVDDLLFDEQGWSREDAYTAKKDLVKLYNAYFKSIFAASFPNAITEQTHLKKKINITIEERNLLTDAVVETLQLPTFYMLYNTKPVLFNDTLKIQLLGINATVLQVPVNGKIVLPFAVNATAENVVVTVKDNFGTTLNTKTLTNITGKKIYTYAFDLSTVTLALNTIYFEVSLKCGLTEIVKNYRLMRFPDYAVKEIIFQNNFGYFIPTYFDGELEVVNGLKIEDYKQSDGTSKVFEINEEALYTINTGHLLLDERAVINDIINSLEVRFKIDADWVSIQTKTKKELLYRDKKHNYANDLQFTFVKSKVINNGFAVIPTQLNITVTGNENDSLIIDKTTIETKFTGEESLQKIKIISLTSSGNLQIQTNAGTLNAVVNGIYNWADIVYLKFNPTPEEFGIPYTTFSFATADSLFSLPATATININEVIGVGVFTDIKWSPELTVESRTGTAVNQTITVGTDLYTVTDKTWQKNTGSGFIDIPDLISDPTVFNLTDGLNQFRLKALNASLIEVFSIILEYYKTIVSQLPTSSYYYEGRWPADDTIHNPDINSWVDYIDEYGVEQQFMIGALENGCQEIIASSIVRTNGVNVCEPLYEYQIQGTSDETLIGYLNYQGNQMFQTLYLGNTIWVNAKRYSVYTEFGSAIITEIGVATSGY